MPALDTPLHNHPQRELGGEGAEVFSITIIRGIKNEKGSLDKEKEFYFN
jgi:hypothetical protein